ncbi:MAG: PAS domain S-box protein [Treponema sp.]|nr:PAS domain S-box protein [Treponema sp.]
MKKVKAEVAAVTDEKKQVDTQLMIMSSIVHNSPNIASYKKFSGECIYVNPAAASVTGFTHDEIMADYFGTLFDEETARYILKEVPKELHEKRISNYEVPVKMKDGTARSFAVTSFLVEEDAYASIATDITETKKLEAERAEAHNALQSSKNIMENILNGLDALIYVTDPDTNKILFVNESMKRHFEIGDEAIGKLCYKVFQKGMDDRCDFCPCFRLDQELDNVIEWEEKNTLTKRIYNNSDRYIDWPGRNKVHIQYSDDITELKQAQESLKQRTKMLSVLNEAAIMFMAQMEEGFEDMMTAGLRLIADELQLSRITIWRNAKMPDGLRASQIYRWHKESGGTTKPTAGLENILYTAEVPRWETLLGRGECINSPARLIPEADIIKPFGVVSMFIAPLFMGSVFWGAAIFEDLETERFFDEASVDIMRSTAYLCTNTITIYEMIQHQHQK